MERGTETGKRAGGTATCGSSAGPDGTSMAHVCAGFEQSTNRPDRLVFEPSCSVGSLLPSTVNARLLFVWIIWLNDADLSCA